MIPERLPYRASAGEQRLFSILQRLPDDCVVYYEPLVGSRRPDFVVLCPDLGLLVIEVKGWYLGDVLSASPQEIMVRENGRPVQREHPLCQARNYMFSLLNHCQRHPGLSRLLNATGKHANKLCFPCGHLAVLSNITTAQLSGDDRHAAVVGGLSVVFPPKQVVTRDVLLGWEDFSEAQIVEVLQTYFDPFWRFPRLSETQVSALRAAIHPEILLSPLLGLEEEVPTVKVLDLRQESHAQSVGRGHRLLFGVAGSGKTVILLARARLLASAGAGCPVLVLCFNVAFAAKLRATLADCPHVHVAHFEGWAKQNHVVRQRRRGAPLESLESLGQRLHLRLERGEGDARRFDAVLIDEAQDFEANWFRCAVAAMQDPLEGDLLLVGDGNQGLYRRREFRWSEVGVQARGRTISARFELDRNYRNTREIAELAALFAAPPTANGQMDDESIPALAADPGKCPRSGGQRPVLVRARDRVDECARALKIVEDLCAGKWFGETVPAPAPEEIGVLYRAMCPAKEKLFRRFLNALGRIAPTVWLTEPGCPQARERVGEKAIMVQTIHSAKGLQYKAVVLLWADDLPAAYANTTPDAERRLFYVACTRAEDWLAVTSSESSAFVEEIQRSGRAAMV